MSAFDSTIALIGSSVGFYNQVIEERKDMRIREHVML